MAMVLNGGKAPGAAARDWRVAVLDCDGTWVLVAPEDSSSHAKRPVKLAIRIDQIAGLKEIAA